MNVNQKVIINLGVDDILNSYIAVNIVKDKFFFCYSKGSLFKKINLN